MAAKKTVKQTETAPRARQTRTRTGPARMTVASDRDAAPQSAAARTNGGGTAPSHGEIAVAAYYRFLERGGQPGFDLDDWIAAERALRQHP